MIYQDIPWPEDEHGTYPTTHRTYFRTWKGMPLRKDWNAMPFHSAMQQCTRCGYKWGQTDFEYMDGSFTNGHPNPVVIHEKCWNCWMADTNHAQVRAYWDNVDRASNPTSEKKQTKTTLRSVGELK